jgi:hypothetical protein
VLVYIVMLFVLYSYLVREVDVFHWLLLVGSIVLLGIGVVLAMAGVSIGVSLLPVMLAPFSVVVGYEALGYRHEAAVLGRILADDQRAQA